MRPCVLVLAAATIAACGREELKSPRPTQAPAPSAANSPPAAAAAFALDDAQIATVAATLNDGQVALAQAVQPHLADPGVAAFTTTMLQERTAAQTAEQFLQQQLALSPADNSVSEHAGTAIAASRERLEGLAKDATSTARPANAPGVCVEGSAQVPLDCAFVTSEVELDAAALHVFDQELLPQVKDPQLQQLLGNMRTMIASQLAAAEALAATGVSDAGVQQSVTQQGVESGTSGATGNGRGSSARQGAVFKML
jgi:hypothetical protein